MGRQYKRGNEFPHEGFVQDAIERHFASAGYSLDTSTHVDLLCTHPVTGEAWHIEAKGKTSAIGLDFRTCLGQLLQRMSQQNVSHGVALPDMPQYRDQTEQVSAWVADRLGLHWLFVAEDGTVEIVRPIPSNIRQPLDPVMNKEKHAPGIKSTTQRPYCRFGSSWRGRVKCGRQRAGIRPSWRTSNDFTICLSNASSGMPEARQPHVKDFQMLPRCRLIGTVQCRNSHVISPL